MSLALAIPVAEAAVFTLGCAAIHALRRQAEGVTLGLAGILAILVLLLAVARTPEMYLTVQADGSFEETAPLQPEN